MDKIDTLHLDDAGLLDAFDFAKRAQDRAAEAFRLRFPVDATIRWTHGPDNSVQFGQVLDTPFGGRVRVRNTETGAEYRVRVWRVLEALREGLS